MQTSVDLRDLVYRDDLTRIYNRRYFYKYLKEEIRWGEPDATPVTLLMIDLDHFKQINDTYGHLAGDNTLVHVSEIFREKVGDDGFVVRYAGDEFSILLPGRTKEDANSLALEIAAKLEEKELRLESTDTVLKLTLSVGIASFPEDGSDPKAFIEEADRALYVSKRRGRNCVSLAGATVHEESRDFHLLDIFPSRKTIGQDQNLEMFRGILDTPDWVRNSLVLVNGHIGMGKSRFLHDVEAEGRSRGLTVVRYSCMQRDSDQPLYIFRQILESLAASIPSDHRGRGLTPSMVYAIRCLLPRFFGENGSTEDLEPPELVLDDLIAGGTCFVKRVAAGKPLLLLLDDLQFADSRSLETMGQLLRDQLLPVVFAGSVRDREDGRDNVVRSRLGVVPHKTYEKLAFVETRLSPLSPSEIGRMIRGIFQGIRLDRASVHKIWDLTKGNPFYTEELLKGLVNNEYIVRVDIGWDFKEVPWEDLPSTLEEAVREHLGRVDVETEELITCAAALGSRFDLETVRQVTKKGTAEVLEMLDRGAEANIIRPSEPFSDDHFEFVSAYAQELKESETDADRRQDIHERIASYEEHLHLDHLSEVVGRLHYHYGRSGNRKKADQYFGMAEKLLADGLASPRADVESEHSGVRLARARIKEADTPLSGTEMGLMQNVLRFFSATLKNRLIYPPGSRIIAESTKNLFSAMEKIFQTCRVFTLSNAKDDMLVNGVKVDPRQFVTGNREFLDLLKKHNILSITITREVELRELEGFRDLLYQRTKEDGLDHEFWDRNLDKKEIEHISVDQRVYVVAGTERAAASVDPDGAEEEEAETSRPEGTGRDVHPDVEPHMKNEIEQALGGSADEKLAEVIGEIIRLLESGTPREKTVGIHLFGQFMEKLRDVKDRERLLRVTEQLLDHFDQDLTERTFGPISRTLAEGAREFIKRGNYEISARIVRFLGYKESREAESRVMARDARRALSDIIRSGAFDLILADLISDDVRRQGEVREILLEFNDLVVEPLIRVIKENNDYRTRKFTSLILKELGERAVRDLKRELNETTPDDEYRRILGVLDTFPDDFTTQLSQALCHPNSSIRSEASKLLRKIRGDIDRILLDVLKSGEGSVAAEAIGQLGRLKCKDAVAPILDKLGAEGAHETVLYEGCQALGRIGDPRAIELLSRVLTGGRLLFFAKRYSKKVRFAAAWALAQIDSPEAKEVLGKVRKDRDSDIRALATRSARTP